MSRARLVLVLVLVPVLLVGALMSVRDAVAARLQDADRPPAAGECDDVDSVDLADLLRLADDLDEVAATPVAQAATIDPAALPTEPEVSEDDLEEIEDTVRLFVACVNAEDPLRIAALLSERFLAELVLDLLAGTDRMAALADELPILAEEFDADEPMEMIEIASAVYDDSAEDAALAVLEPELPGVEEQRAFVVRFVEVEGDWLIDEIWVLAEE